MSYPRHQIAQQLARGGALVGILAGSYLLSTAIYNVEPGWRAIKFSRWSGVQSGRAYGEGMHLAIPWLEWPIFFDVRAKPRSIASLTGTKDLQMVDINLRVLYKPDEKHLDTIYRNLGKDFDERVLPSIVNEVLKSVVAQFNASQLITQREKVSLLIRQRLVERARQFNLLLDDVSIVAIQFSEQFASAVEQKQIAQQQAHRAAFLVDKATQEKQSIILRAEGEAESASVIGKAISNNPAFLELRRIEAARDIAHTIAKGSNRAVLSSESLLLSTLHTPLGAPQ